jgi:hypothetical protein
VTTTEEVGALHDWRKRAILIVALLGAAAALHSATHIAPVVPNGLTPLPPELDREVRSLLKAAEHYRGLSLEHPVPRGVIDLPGLRKAVSEDLDEDLPPARRAEAEAALKAFGLMPDTMSLATYLPDLLSSQTAGFYDAKRKYLAIVARAGGLLEKPNVGEDSAAEDRRMDNAVLVHELTHAIQDQHFDLEKLTSDDPLLDASLAESALAEGDATLTMFDYIAGVEVEQSPELARRAIALLHGPQHAGQSGVPGEKELEEAPAWFRETLLFSYTDGFAFCLKVRQQGGQKLLDYAFSTDPPRSTEQVIHPEKWYGKRDDPVAIEFPDLSPALGGWKKAAEGEMGEEGIRVLLHQNLKDEHAATAAAEGWGGDRFTVWEQNGRRLVAWATEWDTRADATEFLAAAARLGHGWQAERTGATRVVVLRNVATADQRAVIRLLAAAVAKPPLNRPVPRELVNAQGAPEEGRKTAARGLQH